MPMRKEIVIAICVGFVIGLIITFGIYTANRALKQKSQPAAELSKTEVSSSSPAAPRLILEISEPEINLVVKKTKLLFPAKQILK